MPRLNLEEYFDGTDNKYYDSNILISILEQILGKSLSEIKDEVNNAQISVTSDEIVKFLEEKFQEKDPELKKRIENPKPRKEISSGPIQFTLDNLLTPEEFKESSQALVDGLSAQRYYFEPYTLEYFNRYTTIVRNKALQLLNIVEQIGTRQSIQIQDLLIELDIQLDENGNIMKEDIIRLITPTIQNITELNEKIDKANDLSTYLTFKMSKHSLYKEGWSEGEVYPTKSIFVRSIYSGDRYGNVPISNRQKQELREEFRKGASAFSKTLTK